MRPYRWHKVGSSFVVVNAAKWIELFQDLKISSI